MKEVTFVNATSVDQAVSALGPGAAVYAGGTDIFGYMKAMVSPNAPDTLVNIQGITGLDYITEESGVLKIGAMTKLADIAASSVVQGSYTALAQAALKVATPELRNMGTIAGNICQLVRCWYYRGELNLFDCIRKGGALCYATLGDNRYNSIFGAEGGCVSVNPSDTAAALVALDASVVTSSRTIAIDDFFAFNVEKTTVLADDEMVTEIQVPTPAAGVKSAFVKFAIRKSFDFPVVNCAAAIGGGSARICLNAVSVNPLRVTGAEDAISGQAINEANAEAAASELPQTTVLPHNRYKIQLAKTMVKRAILGCA
ncbi:MAG: FAD binding domain-containing protein [Dehalococcoidia bacterium]|nr:MAG: FAD binding domain-containing protein [Dehalococcoidia bacterium]